MGNIGVRTVRRHTAAFTGALLMALMLACAHAARPPGPVRCRVEPVDVTGWQNVQVVEGPVGLRVPASARRYLALGSVFYPTGWEIPDPPLADSASQATTLLVEVRRDTVVDPKSLNDMIAQWFAPDPARECDVFVVKVGARPLRVTIFQSHDSSRSQGSADHDPWRAPYAVDGIMPLVKDGPQRSWLVFEGLTRRPGAEFGKARSSYVSEVFRVSWR